MQDATRTYNAAFRDLAEIVLMESWVPAIEHVLASTLCVVPAAAVASPPG